jgi:formate dehydrogenase assembly factor FdhD
MQKGISGIRDLISKGISKVVSSAGKPTINLDVKIKTRELEILKQKQRQRITRAWCSICRIRKNINSKLD